MNNKLYKLMNWPEIEGIIYSEDDNPNRLLGPHQIGSSVLFQMFRPDAKKASILLEGGKKTVKMELADEDGYFAALVPGKIPEKYEYQVTFADKKEITFKDAYQFGPVITKKETERFNAGIHYSVFDILGAHPKKINGISGVHFAVWAPFAIRVSAVGDFNNWDGRIHQMRRLWDSGIFEIFIPDAKVGDKYKFELKVKGGLTYLKADPYAESSELRPKTASIVADINSFEWHDNDWMKNREIFRIEQEPISVYEMHMGSFAKPEDDREFYNYRELAPMVINYVKKVGYTHVELMPIMEHPLDASWGYQVIGYYAPTSRYGKPEDFMYFMDELHKAGIGVILDWVPAHFPRDVQGLSNFDGTCLYEHQNPKQGYHPHWGTLIYNYGRPEVRNYLIGNALYWLKMYHADGIRMDAVASMLYLDYGKNDGEWVPNMYGGNENLEAVSFLKELNTIVHKLNKGIMMIAEESTAWPMVTGDTKDETLGFDLKWNMGFMNDYLEYIKYDPYFRSGHHSELTFSMIYQYSEKFQLVFSHDEVVHGKSSMIGKMPGTIEQKFSNLRLTYSYTMMHPGKKLIFMGQDIGEFDEWNEDRSIQWELTKYQQHKEIQDLVIALNQFYKKNPALYEYDCKGEGFEWINNISANECMLVFLRKNDHTDETLLVTANFANVLWKNHKIGVPFAGRYREIFCSEGKEFGGSGAANKRAKTSVREECDDREYSIKVNMAPLSVSVFSCIAYTKEELEEIRKKELIKQKEAEAKAKEEVKHAKALAKKTGVKAKAASNKISSKKK